jgi:hypothetical protein
MMFDAQPTQSLLQFHHLDDGIIGQVVMSDAPVFSDCSFWKNHSGATSEL